jgi:hypothetical protein
MQLRVPDTVAPGAQVKCPQCTTVFAVPAANPAPPATPGQFSARPTSPASPGAQVGPRFSSAPGPDDFDHPDAAHRPRPDAKLEGLTSDYVVSLGDDFSAGMKHYSPALGPMVGYGFILWGIMIVLGCGGAIPFIGLLFSCLSLLNTLFLQFALIAGYVVVCLRQMRGDVWTFGDFFGGFRYWLPLFVNNLLSTALMVACFAPGYILLIVGQILLSDSSNVTFQQPGGPKSATATPATGQPGAMEIVIMLAGLGIMLLGIVPAVYVSIRAFLFNPWLIIDRGCGPIEAIKGNWELTRGHFWGWLGFSIVLGLILLVGAIPCYLGLPFTFPIMYLVLTAAWLRITSAKRLAGPL